MKQRFCIITVDTLSELLHDYIGNEDDFPADAQPIRLMHKPGEKGKLALEIMSENIKPGAPPLEVSFKLKRVYSV